MYKTIAIALVTAASTLGAGAASAHGISWSIGINTPIVGTVISNGPAYAPSYGPVYERAYEPVYAPAPVYAPVPVYEQAPIYVAPPVAYDYYRGPHYRPIPVVYPRFYPGRHDYHGDWRHDRHDHRDDRGWRR